MEAPASHASLVSALAPPAAAGDGGQPFGLLLLLVLGDGLGAGPCPGALPGAGPMPLAAASEPTRPGTDRAAKGRAPEPWGPLTSISSALITRWARTDGWEDAGSCEGCGALAQGCRARSGGDPQAHRHSVAAIGEGGSPFGRARWTVELAN